MKLKLHPRIKIPVEFSDVGVVKPGEEFEVADEKRGNEFIELGYAESSAEGKSAKDTKTTHKAKDKSPKGKSTVSTKPAKAESEPATSETPQ